MAGFVSYALTDRVAYPHPDGANGAFGAFVFEVIYTTYLVFIVLCVATPTSEIDAQDGTDEDTPQSYYGMAIGFTVGAGTQHSRARPHATVLKNHCCFGVAAWLPNRLLLCWHYRRWLWRRL